MDPRHTSSHSNSGGGGGGASATSLSQKNLPTISIGQALLILIEQRIRNSRPCDDLKKLYFLGIQNNADRQRVLQLIQNPIIANRFSVSTPPDDRTLTALTEHYKVIDQDQSRRYFETQLAYETLRANTIANVCINELTAHCRALEALLPTTEQCQHLYTADEKTTLPTNVLDIVNNILSGDFRHVKAGVTTDILSAQEYSDAYHRLRSDEHYTDFSADEKAKLALILRCSFLCVTVLRHIGSQLPFSNPDLYKQGFYDTTNGRGQIKKTPQDQVRSHHLGLMLSHMWVPHGDSAYSTDEIGYLRVADRNTFNASASWPQFNFGQMVHPFSCSISGTMLIHLKIFKHLENRNNFALNDTNKFANFLKVLIPLMIFNSGGHSFFEFMFPLSLSEIQKSFDFIPNFNTITTAALFLTGNAHAFDKALTKAIEYNKVTIAAKAVHHDVRLFSHTKLKATKSKPSQARITSTTKSQH